VINGLRQKILLYRHRQLYQTDRFTASIQEHRDLLEAFRSRNADAAESLMKRHLMNQCEAIVGLPESWSNCSDSHE
jgi:DNA-binding GntR family transcriptional regulator